MSSNILKQADEIINNRSEEKERQYGPLGEGFERAAMIASGMTGKTWSADDMFVAMILSTQRLIGMQYKDIHLNK